MIRDYGMKTLVHNAVGKWITAKYNWITGKVYAEEGGRLMQQTKKSMDLISEENEFYDDETGKWSGKS